MNRFANNKILKLLFIPTIIITAGIIFMLFAQNDNKEKMLCNGIYLASTINKPYPEYVLKAYPTPNSRIRQVEYSRESGITLRLDILEIYKIFEGEDYLLRPFNPDNTFKPSTSQLFINSKPISNKKIKVYGLDEITELNDSSNVVIYKGIRQLELIWNINLSPGDYEVQYIIRNDLGCDILSYTWDFVIVDE